ncbi:YhdP family protein [Psychromonas sp. SP041]|uniref:YhdP family protein n=1 Tax=Psychromonas sp. SP041 TaxID=1365007 RepID=UPI0010C7BFFA|nr:YhdP family protein [Psychromonas sp. SP041]
MLTVVTLILIAILLTAARFAINSVDDYKEQLVEWVAAEHDINVNADKVTAGVDFSGLVLTLKNVTFTETEALPFELKIDNLFLHFDFLESLRKQQITFNDISLKGANLLLKSSLDTEDIGQLEFSDAESQSQSTLDALKNIFLLRLSSFSITESRINFTDHLYNKKTILIQELSWINDGEHHQGVGKASLPNTLDGNSLEFIIDIKGDAEGANEQLIGSIYAHADNLNVAEYIRPQINPLAELKTATTSFKLWSEFDFNGPKTIQLEWGNSEIAWLMLGQSHDWQVNHGTLQFTYQNNYCLFDSYDLNITHNFVPFSDVKISADGTLGKFGGVDLNGIDVSSIMPFGLLFSSLSEADIKKISALEIGGKLNKIGLNVDKPGELTINANIDAFNNQAVGVIPAVSDANISVTSNQHNGYASIKLGPQDIYFDGQFNRPMPLQEGDFALSWKNNEDGFELMSEKSLLITNELNSLSQFSLFFPNENAENTSPILNLYSYASLNDASKAQHYFPIHAMGEDVFNYLKPTLKKGTVEGAKILWSGRLSDYPFEQDQGVFQAFVPVKNAEYDFYEGWKGLSDLDLNLLFENDSLLMKSNKAKLGDIKVDKLMANIDHLSSEGLLTVNVDLEEKSQSIVKYLIASPLKDSVGKAVQSIHINDRLKGNLVLTIPLAEDNDETQVSGKFNLNNNDIDIELGSDSLLPLKHVKGAFSFINGDLTADDLTATLFDQPVNISFFSKEYSDKYELKANIFGQWDVAKLSRDQQSLLPLQLSGNLDWQGKMTFTQHLNKDYKFGVHLTSQLQGVKVNLPLPYNKNSLQAWPTTININGDQNSMHWDALVSNKLKSSGELAYPKQKTSLNYLYLGLGKDTGIAIDKTKQIIRINQDKVNLTPWAEILNNYFFKPLTTPIKTAENVTDAPNELINIDAVYLKIKHAELFEQPLINLSSDIIQTNEKLDINVKADNLLANVEYRQGIPDRYDIDIKEFNFQFLDMEALQATLFNEEKTTLTEYSDNLREDYPEIFLECFSCVYKKMDLSSLKTHVYPSQSRFSIDYLQLGDGKQSTNISGVWDQRRTNIIVDSHASSDTSIIHRLGYNSPLNYQNAQLNGSFNWVGAPWEFNLDSLNGDLSLDFEDGQITEVDDKGARLLSFLSLDGIRRSLNLEFGNVFSKGLGFDEMSFSANITNGILKNDDYYLDGSAGKISGNGLIDLPNLNVNYRFSYSPAVTSSLPVLAAFAINPLTGAAVLMLTKIFEPVVDTIIRVDFSVKGALSDPEIKIEDRLKGTVKLQNSEVLEEIEDQQLDNNSLQDILLNEESMDEELEDEF